MVPPHPAPTLAAAAFHADLGRTILYGLLVGLPVGLLAGPGYALIAQRFIRAGVPPTSSATEDPGRERSDRHVPPLAAVLTAILLPPILMMARSVADAFLAAGSLPREGLDFAGDPIMALLLTLLYAMFALGVRTGRSMSELQTLLGKSLARIFHRRSKKRAKSWR